MTKVVITHPIHHAGIDILKGRYEVVVNPETRRLNEDELCGIVQGADVILSLLTDPITERVMEAAGPQLRMIAQYTVGYDNVDVEAAHRRGITVTNTAGTISAPSMAEYVVGTVLMLARYLKQGDTYMRNRQYQGWDPYLFVGELLSKRTLGIIGSGQIGSLVARAFHNGFGIKVVYNDVKRNEAFEKDLGALYVERDELLMISDIVSIHVPLLPTTRHLMDAESIGKMKPNAILVNTSRGPVVDEEALVQALREQKIMGAVLDVYEYEPDMVGGLAELDNVVLTPHISSSTESTRMNMSMCVARNIIAFMTGETPPNLIK